MHLSFKTVRPIPSQASKLYKPSHIWFMYCESTKGKGITNSVHLYEWILTDKLTHKE